ncbi:hypothetical protein CYMTET_4876 [Cymbomonas tetramitiformis]|uniref:Uncharacterized protein n=1 Tax=Cymbomonas tetramitiformis TaxID=36881 RepID=A0AAE0H0A7_9CHLO|nr:hypothetical protein CYMTET_4876 [Cymbomonas tetramitiformis]
MEYRQPLAKAVPTSVPAKQAKIRVGSAPDGQETSRSGLDRGPLQVKPGESVQRRIDEAHAGAVILLEPGQYEESLHIAKEVHLKAQDGDVIFQSSSHNQPALHVPDSRIGGSIRHVTFSPKNHAGPPVRCPTVLLEGGPEGDAQAQAVPAGRLLLEHCRVRGGGIHISARASAVVTDADIAGGAGCGVEVDDLACVRLTRCKVHSCARSGMVIHGPATISECTIVENKGHGILVDQKGAIELTSTCVYGNGLSGILMASCNKLHVSGCKVYCNREHGVFCVPEQTGEIVLDSLLLFGNHMHGLRAPPGTQATLKDVEAYCNGGKGQIQWKGVTCQRTVAYPEQLKSEITALMAHTNAAEDRLRLLSLRAPPVDKPLVDQLDRLNTDGLDAKRSELRVLMDSRKPAAKWQPVLRECLQLLEAQHGAVREHMKQLEALVEKGALALAATGEGEEVALATAAAGEGEEGALMLAAAEREGGRRSANAGSGREKEEKRSAAGEGEEGALAAAAAGEGDNGSASAGRSGGKRGRSIASPAVSTDMTSDDDDDDDDPPSRAKCAKVAKVGAGGSITQRAPAMTALAAQQPAQAEESKAVLPSHDLVRHQVALAGSEVLPPAYSAWVEAERAWSKKVELVKERLNGGRSDLSKLKVKGEECMEELQKLQGQLKLEGKAAAVAADLRAAEARETALQQQIDTLKQQLSHNHGTERGLREALWAQSKALPAYRAQSITPAKVTEQLCVTRSIRDDYEEKQDKVQRDGRHVLLARLKGQPDRCVLRSLEGRHTEQVGILVRLHHPLVVPVEAVVFDVHSNRQYLQTPYSAQTLEQWAESAAGQPYAWYSVARQLLEALAHVHAQGVVHSQLRPSKVLVRANKQIWLTGLCWRLGDAPESGVAGAVYDPGHTGPGCLAEEMSLDEAPEVQAGQAPTQASDMWCAGRIIYKLAAGVAQPAWPVRGVRSDALRELLEALLQEDPARRPTAAKALASPGILRDPAVDDGCALPSAEKLLQYLSEARRVMVGRRQRQDAIEIELKRNSGLLNPLEVVTAFNHLMERGRRIWNPFKVIFADEDGDDYGGLTTEMYQQTFQLLGQLDVFEDADEEPSGLLLPKPDISAESKRTLKGVGYLMARCLYDGRTTGPRFAPYMYKYLQLGDCAPASRDDLDHFDARLGRQMTDLLNAQGLPEGCEDLTLQSGEALTATNKAQFVREMVVPRNRMPCLRVLRRAFYKALTTLKLHNEVAILPWPVLQELLEGAPSICAEDLVTRLHFSGYPCEMSIRARLKAALTRMTEEDLRRLLHAITGSRHLPAPYLAPNAMHWSRFTIEYDDKPERWPSFSTCNFSMRLPVYDIIAGSDPLYDNIMKALGHVDGAGFTLI